MKFSHVDRDIHRILYVAYVYIAYYDGFEIEFSISRQDRQYMFGHLLVVSMAYAREKSMLKNSSE